MSYYEVYKDLSKEGKKPKEVSKKHNLPINNYGNSRVIFDLENSVLKVPQNEKGIIQNKNEIQQWQNKKKLRKFLGEIKDYSSNYRWLIMKKYQKASKGDASILKEKLKKFGYKPPGDYNHRNVGIDKENHNIVIIDYGYRIKKF